MALLDRFKNKNTGKKEVEKTAKVAETAWKFLVSPHVTEKAAGLEEKNKYVFRVSDRANKTEIKKAVRQVYGVNVEDVKIINVHPKKRRVGKRGEGWRKGYKKAIIRIEEGQKIEILPR
ncbi:MAG: 50S ribosomal protein L23 [bacterium]|nr:50S ribosomal protein L23 [bacterium]